MDRGQLLSWLLGSLEVADRVPLCLLSPAVAHFLGSRGPGGGRWAFPHSLQLEEEKFQGTAVCQKHSEQGARGNRQVVGPWAEWQGFQGRG